MQVMDPTRMDIALNPRSRKKHDSTFADHTAVCAQVGIPAIPVTYLSVGIYMTFKAGVNGSAASLVSYCTHVKRSIADHHGEQWFPTDSIANKWILQLRRGLSILHFKEAEQSEPFRQSMTIQIEKLDFSSIGLSPNVKSVLIAMLDQAHDGTHRVGELLTPHALREDCSHVGKHLVFKFNEFDRPEVHKTSCCPPAVLHRDARSFSSLHAWWSVSKGSKHAFCHVNDDGTLVPDRHLAKSTVQRWLRPVFALLKITNVTLHGLRAAGLMHQMIRGVNPMFSALQGHWSLNSQSQFAHARLSPLERLEHLDQIAGCFGALAGGQTRHGSGLGFFVCGNRSTTSQWLPIP